MMAHTLVACRTLKKVCPAVTLIPDELYISAEAVAEHYVGALPGIYVDAIEWNYQSTYHSDSF